jgi:hypothetical protein
MTTGRKLVRQVLGETTDEGAFVRRLKLQAPPGADAYQASEGRWRYEVHAEEYPIEAYEQLKA